MQVLGNRILVEELKKDRIEDGLVIKYDESSHFIFAKVVQVGTDVSMENHTVFIGSILVLQRVNKVPIFNGQFIVSLPDVLMVLTEEEYQAL